MTTRTGSWLLPFAGLGLEVTGTLPAAAASALRPGRADVEPDLEVATEGGRWHITAPGLDRRLAVEEAALPEALVDVAGAVAAARRPAHWHVVGAAVQAGPVGLVLVGARDALARAVHGLDAGTNVLGTRAVALHPASRTATADGWGAHGPLDPAPATSPLTPGLADGRLVVDAIVVVGGTAASEGDDPGVVAGEDLRARHPSAGVAALVQAASDVHGLGPAALDAALATAASSTCWALPPSGELGTAPTDLPTDTWWPAWRGRHPRSRRRRLGWIAGTGLTWDPADGALGVVGPVVGNDDFAEAGHGPTIADGLADGPAPWRASLHSAPHRRRPAAIESALAELARRGVVPVVIGPHVDAIERRMPTPVGPAVALVEHDDLARDLAADPSIAQRVAVVGPHRLASSLGAAGVAVDIAEVVGRAWPLRVEREWVHRPSAAHHAVLSVLGVGGDASGDPDRLAVASAAALPVSTPGVEEVTALAARWSCEGRLARAVADAAGRVGGVPEVWHDLAYGRRRLT